MADMTIDDATQDTNVTGVEKLPASDGGAAKSVSVSQIKDFVLAQIAAMTAANAVSMDDDSVYILRGGALTRATASVLAAAMFNEAFGRAAVAAPNGNEVFTVKDSSARKTLTLGAIKTWLQSNMTVTPDLTLSTASVAGTLGDSDLALVVQAAAGKKVTLATLKDYVLGKLASFIGAATAAQTVSTSDVLFLAQGGNVRKITVGQLMAAAGGGDVIAPSSQTPGNIPAWDDAAKKLTNGYGVASSISGSPSATKIPTEAAVATALSNVGNVKKSGVPTGGKLVAWDNGGNVTDGPAVVTSVGPTGADTNVPTEKAVRDAIAEASGVGAPVSHTEGNIPTWGEGAVLTDGVSVKNSIAATTATASNDAVPTEKAVREALDECVAMPESHTEDAIPTWGSGSELKGGLTVVPSSTGIASSSNASDVKIPTEKAVREALPVAATQSAAGLMSAADKTKLDGLTDMSGLSEISAELSDSDTIQIKQSDTTWKKSLLSRFWTYISGKLSTFKIDDLAAGDDNTDCNASTTKHGLCPKLSGNTAHFLRGDGTFATPAGMTPFTGTDGESAGVQGLVPAPATTEGNKFLSSDGTWKSVEAAAAEDVAAEVFAITHYDTVFIPAAAMVPSAANGATASAITFTNTKRDTMVFGTVYDNSCEFDLVLPDDWNKGALKAKFVWTVNDNSASSSTNVKWGIGCVSTPDGGSVSVGPTDFEEVTDMLSQVNNLQRTDATDAFAPEGTTGDGNLLHFVVRRMNANPPSSPLSKSAILLGVVIQFARTTSMEAWS